MYLLIGVFLVCCLGIVVTAYWSIESIKAVSEKYKISDTFVGAVFLSVGTSFPEFINSIVSGFMDKGAASPTYATYSFYNITGANIWQIVFLAVSLSILSFVFLLRRKTNELEKIVNIFWNDSILSWQLVFLETVFLFFIFLFPSFFSNFIFKGFNLINLAFLGLWLWYLGWTYKNESTFTVEKQKQVNKFADWNKYSLVAISIFLWIVFGFFSYTNFYISSKFPLNGSTAFGIILSFITSMPEFCVLFFLFRKREYLIAVGGFFGSSLFNLTLPTYTNWISANPIMTKDLNVSKNGHPITHERIYFWLLLNIICLILFLGSFPKWKRIRPPIMFANGLLIGGIYLSANFFLNIF